tara:strand:- start:1620 stop:1892 length:273 start_codon:yes stop_codon:yes gene_type:complete
MKDLILKNDNLSTSDTSTFKARNILSTEVGALSYAPTFGIDYNLFFGKDYEIQTKTFEAYAISKLAEHGVNPIETITEENTFDALLKIQL